MSINTTQTYLDRITSEHSEKPNFMATVALSVSPFVQLQNLLTDAEGPLYDVDLATGIWLDYIGQWAGISRNVNVPITGIYFTWDDLAQDGWDSGTWQGEFDPSTGITKLPDDAYRTLIKAKIAANAWDGTTEGAYAIWAAVFKNTEILIQDNQDMSYILGIIGTGLDALTIALLQGGYIPLKPEGVRVAFYAVPVDTNPFFAWDLDTDFVNGWDVGSWAKILPPT